jgi:hypothetical protein
MRLLSTDGGRPEAALVTAAPPEPFADWMAMLPSPLKKLATIGTATGTRTENGAACVRIPVSKQDRVEV